MIDPDKLLREGAERRERASNKRELLEVLRRTTSRKRKWLAVPCIVGAILYFWIFTKDFLSDEPMSKGDVFSLIHYSFMCGWLFYMGTNVLSVNRQDLFLIELLEKEIQNEKTEPNQ